MTPPPVHVHHLTENRRRDPTKKPPNGRPRAERPGLGDLAAARGWAAEAGHLLAPLDVTFQGYRVGIWLKNARGAARKAQEIEQRRAEGLPAQSSAGALSEERREHLEEIDPS